MKLFLKGKLYEVVRVQKDKELVTLCDAYGRETNKALDEILKDSGYFLL